VFSLPLRLIEMGSESGKKLEAVLTEASIKFRINNVSELKEAFYGPSVNVDGICFRPMVNQTEDKKRRFTNLGLFLHCNYNLIIRPMNNLNHIKNSFHKIFMVVAFLLNLFTGDLPAGVETCNAKMHFTLFAQDRKTENKTLEGK